MRPGISHRPLGLALAAAFCAAGMWLYVSRVLIPYQIADAAAHRRPRGNLSDLYQHWVSARALLLHRRNPYGPDVTREIQQGYYGRSLDRAGDPRDQHFAYPLYDVFYLAPVMRFPFEMVRRGFFWVLLCLTVATVPVWLRVIRWSPPLSIQVSLLIFTIGSLSAVQGLKLQQMTLLVAALVAIGLALLTSDRPIAAGIVLALATTKPQLVWLLLFWLLIWTLADWRRRYTWITSFAVTMVILCGVAEYYLPHWIRQFIEAMRQYPSYTDAVSTFDKLLPSPWGLMARALVFAATVHIGWRNRRVVEDTLSFAAMASLTLAATIIVIPSYALYNEIMLLPALLMAVRDSELVWNRNRMSRVLLSLVAIFLMWSWLAALVLAALSFVLLPDKVEAAWAVPFWTVLPLAVAVAGLVLMMSYQGTFGAPARPHPS
jgi:hypothetical protein